MVSCSALVLSDNIVIVSKNFRQHTGLFGRSNFLLQIYIVIPKTQSMIATRLAYKTIMVGQFQKINTF